MQEAVSATAVDHVVKSAKALRDEGRPDLAADLLSREADLASAKADFLYLSLLIALDDNAPLQAALVRSLERLPPQALIPAPYLKLLFRHAERCCLPDARLELVLPKGWRSAKRDPELAGVLRAASRRLTLRRRLRSWCASRASLVSLGLNCMPWSVPNHWGLRRIEDFADLHGPFDHGANKLQLVMRALESDFMDYCTEEAISSVETNGGHLTPIRKDVGAVWNHHLGAYWVSDNFQHLRQTMARQAQNFREACRRDDVVFIMGKAPIDYPARPLGFLQRLNHALEGHTGHAHNRIILLNEYAQSAASRWADDWTLVVNCPYPQASYLWYEEETADTPEGMEYERGWIAQVLAGLMRWGLAERGDAQSAPLASVN